MNNDIVTIDGYMVIHSFFVGEKNVIVAENLKSDYRYVCAYLEENEVFSQFTDCALSNDYLEIMTLYCDRAKEQVENCKAQSLGDKTVITPEMCRKLNEGETYKGKVVALKTDSLRREYENAENQLFYAVGGNGINPNGLGTKVYGYNLATNAHYYNRNYNIIGVVKDECLPEWAKTKLTEIKKDIKNKEVRHNER
jgi:hypothetical protein